MFAKIANIAVTISGMNDRTELPLSCTSGINVSLNKW